MPGDNPTPAGDTPPDYLTKGPPGFEKLNDWFRYLLGMVYLPGDASVRTIPGTSVSPGRIFANGGTGGGTTPATPPLSVVKADAKDAAGATHPGRVRVYNGSLGNLLPDEMSIPDGALPNGTDNHCYLTMQTGTNYVYGKVLVDQSTGRYTSASVYRVGSSEDADGTYAYLLIATVTYDGTTLTISQEATGNQQLFVTFSADGTIITPIWNPTTV